MIKIYYPHYAFKIKEEESGKEFIFDEQRKQWVRLTEEEWVRQNFAQYLLQVKKYPSSYIAVEKKMKLGEMNKRFDILVFNKAAKPWMMSPERAANLIRPVDRPLRDHAARVAAGQAHPHQAPSGGGRVRSRFDGTSRR